jgi:hypothetical protein
MLDFAALALQQSAQVLLLLSSELFAIERAQATFLPADWDSESRLIRGDYRVAFEATDVVDDQIASVALPGPGDFWLFLAQLTVRRLYDGRRFGVAWFAAYFSLAAEDLQHGKATVSLNTTGAYRLSILDRTHRPLRDHQLTFHFDNITMKLATDEDGTIVFLGKPPQFVMDAETGEFTVESF